MKKWTKFQWLYLLPLSGFYRWIYEDFVITVSINDQEINLTCYFKTCRFTNTHMKWDGITYGEWNIVSHSKYEAIKNNKNIIAKTMSPIRTL